MIRRTLLIVGLAVACRAHAPVRPPSPPPAAPPTPPTRDVVVPPPPPPEAPQTGLLGFPTSQRKSTGPLTQAERDSLLREVRSRRDAWRARGIASYRIQIAVGCFCPWPGNPALLEVKNATPALLRDTTGKSIGQPREPWSLYTVDRLFDAVEQGARGADIIEVIYDSTYGYPTWIRGDAKVGLPDDWFWVKASRLTRF